MWLNHYKIDGVCSPLAGRRLRPGYGMIGAHSEFWATLCTENHQGHYMIATYLFASWMMPQDMWDSEALIRNVCTGARPLLRSRLAFNPGDFIIVMNLLCYCCTTTVMHTRSSFIIFQHGPLLSNKCTWSWCPEQSEVDHNQFANINFDWHKWGNTSKAVIL